MLPGETIRTGVPAEEVSELKVMCSAAGWYIGTSIFDYECGCELPNTRESGYYATEEEAEAALRTNNVNWR